MLSKAGALLFCAMSCFYVEASRVRQPWKRQRQQEHFSSTGKRQRQQTSVSSKPARIRVLLIEGANHPGRDLAGRDSDYHLPLHVDYWRNALSSLREAHGIDDVSVDKGNVIISPPAIGVDVLPADLIEKLSVDQETLAVLASESTDPLFSSISKAVGSVEEQLTAFAESLSPSDISVVVFTGHGVQIDGELNLLFANPLFPAIEQQVPRPVWENAGCQHMLGRWLCKSYDEMKQVFDGKGLLSVHIIGACRVTRDPQFNFDSDDGTDPAKARQDFLDSYEGVAAPANVVTLFGTLPGARTWHGYNNELGEALSEEGRLDSVYMKRLQENRTAQGNGGYKYASSYFQERVVGVLGEQCRAYHKHSGAPTVFTWLDEVAKHKIVRTPNTWQGEYSQQPCLEWGDDAAAIARICALSFDVSKCFDRPLSTDPAAMWAW